MKIFTLYTIKTLPDDNITEDWFYADSFGFLGGKSYILKWWSNEKEHRKSSSDFQDTEFKLQTM